MLATLAVSLIGFIISGIILLFSKNKDNLHTPLKILIAFAVGSLLGDAFLHLIPHSFHSEEEPTNHDHELEDQATETEHDHDPYAELLVSIMLVIGFFVFYLIEKIMFLIISNTEDK